VLPIRPHPTTAPLYRCLGRDSFMTSYALILENLDKFLIPNHSYLKYGHLIYVFV